ncbi:dienelactone hydrolase [Billgrantia tianxiuensis]|uniref:Dienelactone hydrolase n=1 Tax=Billgrantia tianxiuensis TaxID=2497861 RepID=A0A6I6SFB5_9GAMM|nr:alpha/beta fold hydrolase [Halomonas sp. MCCC 1A11057]QHC49169.1 dienelactone hydrolase [Halomonas tianxiuensis]
MSNFSRLVPVAVEPRQLRERRLDRQPGNWFVEGLGPLEIRGEGGVGRLLIAHGAGAGQQSPYMSDLRDALARQGVQTLAIEFSYMQRMQQEEKRIPPPRIDRLVEELSHWCDILTQPQGGTPWLGGKSMGGRVASLLAARDGAAGLILCGYPFHPPAKPEKLRLAHWPGIDCPTLVVQGSRDPFGTREEVENYSLGERACIHWLEDGDHDWKPRRRSGRTQADLIEEGAAAIATFIREQARVD